MAGRDTRPCVRSLAEACFELVSHADPPRCARGDLLTGDQAVVQPTMQGRGRNVQGDRRLRDRHHVALRDLRLLLEAGDAPMGPQGCDAIGLESVAASRRSSLSIENARDHSIRVERGETTHEVQRVLVGSDRCGSRARQRHIDIGQCAALPAYRQMGRRFVAIDRENHLLDERSQEFFLITWRRRRRGPDRGQVGAKGDKAFSF